MMKKIDLTTGSIKAHLARTSIPMMFGLLAIISIQLVDTYFISELGQLPLTAISFTFPITYMLFSIIMGISIGTSSVLSRLIGEKNYTDTHRMVTQIFIIALIMTALISCIGILTNNWLFTLLGADEQSLPLIQDFMIPWYIGFPFVSLPIIGNGALRATGDSMTPGKIMVLAAIINLILDPILIFGKFSVPSYGIAGAAYATIISNVAALAIGLYYVAIKKKLTCAAAITQFRKYADTFKRIFHVGAPAAISNIIAPLASTILIAIIATHSQSAVAAFGLATRIEAILFIPMMALAVGLSPIIGQNFGARQLDRVHKTTNYALIFCMLWGLFSTVLLFFISEPFVALFTTEPDVIAIAVLYMTIIPITYGFANATNIWSSTYNAMGMPRRALIMNATKMLLTYIPLCFIGSHFYGLEGIIYAIALCYILTGTAFHLWNKSHHKKIERELLPAQSNI